MKITRPAGGYYAHARVDDAIFAVCGFAPSSKRSHHMKDRSGWYQVRRQTVTCPHCRRSLQLPALTPHQLKSMPEGS